jgi:type II secretory pathway pseudopilin PulG
MKKNRGFTLMETVISVTLFVMISVALYGVFVRILKINSITRTKQVAINLANEQFEIARNLPYASVGTVNGIPSGVLLQSQNIVRDGLTFSVDTYVRNYDDPFDGTFNGSPDDLSPADMKLIEISISCTTCESFTPILLTTKIAPKNLETASTNGALVIRVFDASGLPVANASVHIVNQGIVPAVDLTDETDINGNFTIVDAPPGINNYQVTVTKSGYSTDRTYASGENGNTNPVKPHLSVLLQQITQVSFTIDRTSSLAISSINSQCAATPSFDFKMSGTKMIGLEPDFLKYDQNLVTNGSGVLNISGLEWDTYDMLGIDSTRDIIGTNPLLSLGVPPNATQNLQIITDSKNGRRLVVAVRDQSTGLPVADAQVTLSGGGGNPIDLVTNQGFMSQTDWSGGSGQEAFGDYTFYKNSDFNIDTTTNPGAIQLQNVFGEFVSSGVLISSTFDTGVVSNFRQILWNPGTQDIATGATSARFQIATNTDNATWNFVGPDGTSSTYFTSSNQNINSSHNGDRYLRYKVYLSTEDVNYTPVISDILFTYTSDCIPPGQVSFTNLQLGTEYTIDVSKTGYQSTSTNVTIDSNWRKEEITITP